MKNFWQDLPRPFFILAPMEAVTDVVFRHVIIEAGRPDVFFTEFTNSDSYFSEAGRPSTRGRLAFTEDEQPMVAQIWGSTPEHFAFMSSGLKEQGFAGIDINMGCPAKDVIKTGGGSGMIRTPQLASEVITAAKASGLPVSVKTRLGDLKVEEWKEWLGHILRQGIVNLTIHLRTRKEMSKVEAHFELIPEIKALRDEIAPQTLLTINGDIRDRAHGMELVEKYGIDGVMIGRGIFTNPFAFASTSTPLPSSKIPSESSRRSLATGPAARATPPSLPLVGSGGVAPSSVTRADVDPIVAAVERSSIIGEATLDPESEPTPGLDSDPEGSSGFGDDGRRANEDDGSGRKKKLLDLLRLHLDLFDKYSEELEPRKFEPLKRFFKIYVRDFAGASELRDALMHAKSTDEVRQLINQ